MGLFDNRQPTQQTQQTQQPTADASDPFGRIGGSTPSESGVYPVPGVYPMLSLDVMKIINSRKGDTLFIAEFDIYQSETSARPQGTRMSWIVNFRHDASPGNVKMFIAALMGVQLEEVDTESAKFACSADNPCHGRLIRLEASETTTKSGNPFTVCKFHTIPENVQQEAGEYRQAAGFAPF